jgi:beta-glucosidase
MLSLAFITTAFLFGKTSLALPQCNNTNPTYYAPGSVSSPPAQSVFPSDFLWGFATASYQIEGGIHEGGKGQSVWDTFSHIPGKIADNTTGDIACDSYHRWKEDIALMKQYGVKAHRMSIAWTRIIPSGSRFDKVNAAGVKFYSDIIDELIRNGITPFITLFHWDTPQAITDRYGGLLNRTEFPLDFEYFAKTCFQAFGDRVKHWLTFNEPVTTVNLVSNGPKSAFNAMNS